MVTMIVGIGALVAVCLLAVLLVARLFRKVEQGKALLVSRMRKVDVTFTGQVVLPVLHKAEVMDISVKTIEITRAGKEDLICRGNIRADIRISFFVKVNKTVEDVIKVAQAVGTARASDRDTLQELFHAKFSEALKTVGKQLDFTDLYTKREELRYRIIEVIGVDLNGYHLEDAAIDYLEQTPLTQLDPANVLDAQGIRKITELTAVEHVRTNETQRHEEKLAELRGLLSAEQGARWCDLKAAYVRTQALGGPEDDQFTRAVAALGLLADRIAAVESAINRAADPRHLIATPTARHAARPALRPGTE